MPVAAFSDFVDDVGRCPIIGSVEPRPENTADTLWSGASRGEPITGAAITATSSEFNPPVSGSIATGLGTINDDLRGDTMASATDS